MSDSGKAVFLSYASQDAEAAKRICGALRAGSVEVWFDQSELRGGDAWDQKIRKQIKECALFVPIISANTNARAEGYFRLEWLLAVERSRLMADDAPFLVPVVIDDTTDAAARVPDRFRERQWTRVSSGPVSLAFVARVATLLGGHDPAPTTGAIAADGRREFRGARRKVRLLLVAATSAIALAVAAISFFGWRNQKAGSPVAVAANSEVQGLVAKARQLLIEGDELNRENYALVEDLVKRAVALDPASAPAWATYADLSFWLVHHGFDRSEGRWEAMRRQAERARSLGPELPEAVLVSADVQAILRQELASLERELRELAAKLPENWRVYRTLGTVYRFLGRVDDSLRALQRAHELSGGLPRTTADLVNVLLRRNRYAEAEPLVAEGLRRRRIGRLLVWEQVVRIQWRGDLEGAQAALGSWPAWLLMEDRGAFLAWRAWLWSKQPEKALAVVQRLPRDYLRDHLYTGPRAVLTARAHEAAGHAEAAKADWQATVQLCDRELSSAPQNAPAMFWKAWALARLGDTAAAQAICTQMDQRNLFAPATASLWIGTNEIPALWVSVGRPDRALLELARPRAPDDERLAVTRAMLELDPAYESLRSQPGYQEVLQSALAPAGGARDAVNSPDQKSAPADKSATAADKSVAVLAFTNLSDDKENEYFSDGISEELLNVLAKVPGLRVAARTSAFYFKGKNATAQDIGQKLGVAHMVDGSVRRAGTKVRIAARLSKADTGEQLWSESYERELKDIFALQDEIARDIAAKLQLTLAPGVAVVARPVNPEAYRLCLEAREKYLRFTVTGLAEAEQLYHRALVAEPDFGPALTGLALMWVRRATMQSVAKEHVERQLTAAHAFARRAMELDPNAPVPHAVLGEIAAIEGRIRDAEEAYSRAAERKLNVSDWLVHGFFLLRKGRPDLAIPELITGRELNPLSIVPLSAQSIGLLMTRRFEEMLDVMKIADAMGETPIHFGHQAVGLARLGRRDEAVMKARAALQGTAQSEFAAGFNVMSDGVAAWALAEAGAHRDAEAVVQRLIAGPVAHRYNAGLSLLRMDRVDEAVSWMRDYAQNSIHYPLFLCADDAKLRSDARIREVFRHLNALEALDALSAVLDASAPRAVNAANR